MVAKQVEYASRNNVTDMIPFKGKRRNVTPDAPPNNAEDLQAWKDRMEERVGLLEASVAGIVARVEHDEGFDDEPVGNDTAGA